MEDIVKCYICGTKFDRNENDCCPCCDWFYLGFEDTLDKNEYEEINLTTINKATDNFTKGFNRWGNPINKD